MTEPATPQIVRLSLDGLSGGDKAALMGDVMGRQLAGGAIALDAERPLSCDWTLAPFAPGVALAQVSQGGFMAERSGRTLADGDDDVSIFFGLDGIVPFEQNGRRVLLNPGDALIVAHGRMVRSWWPQSKVTILRLPRAMLPHDLDFDKAGGLLMPRQSPALQLLQAYIGSLWPLLTQRNAPDIAARHLAELTEFALRDMLPGRTDRATDGEAGRSARLAAACEVIARRYSEPDLDMAGLTHALGISERTGYLLFEKAELSFSDLLYQERLKRAAERLRSGYAGRISDLAFDVGFSDVSHFSRRFKLLFGMSPADFKAASILTRSAK